MRAHVMDGNLIANTVKVDSLDAMPNLIDAGIGGAIGDRIVDGVVVPKPAQPLPVPQSVAMWQAREILIEDDLLDDVYAYFETIGDPVEKRKAISKFDTSNTVQRNDPLVKYVIPLMGKSEAEIDDMFRRADAL